VLLPTPPLALVTAIAIMLAPSLTHFRAIAIRRKSSQLNRLSAVPSDLDESKSRNPVISVPSCLATKPCRNRGKSKPIRIGIDMP